MGLTYKVVLLHEQDGRYSAIVPALGVASWGDTVPEALKMVEEAAEGYIESLRAHGEPVPADAEKFMIDMGEAADGIIYSVTVEDQEVIAVA